ncbi:MAG: DUF1566 domain-containing protein [Candidatus Lernaella stagnicola]|nr:DUF1566 domain-containing protein [Candidatus Lernaella stagnicola]
MTAARIETSGGDRFHKTEYRSIADAATGLEWFVGPDRNTTVGQARDFAASLKAGGHQDWRLPNVRELRTIWTPGAGPKNLPPPFAVGGELIWTGELSVFGYVYLRLVNGTLGFDTLARRKHGFRALAVRGPALIDPYAVSP